MTSVARFLSCKLQLLETLHPFAELSFVDTPLATDSKGGQYLLLDHPHHGSRRQLQHVSGLLESQQAQRLITVFRRRFHVHLQLSNGSAMSFLAMAARLLGNAAAQWTT
jgi:hypothetical protein